jgi:hypothetical protein
MALAGGGAVLKLLVVCNTSPLLRPYRLLAISALASLIVVVAAACARAQPPAAQPLTPDNASRFEVAYPKDRPVLQIYTYGQWSTERFFQRMPELTVWGNGDVVFVTEDGLARGDRLAEPVVERVLKEGMFLYDLDERYAAVFAGSGDASTVFSVETAKGRKTVRVYYMDPEKARPNENSHAILEQLREFRRKVRAVLSANAPLLTPDEVIVQTGMLDPGEAPVAELPASLTGQLKGEKAREASRLVGVGPVRNVTRSGRTQPVAVLPMLPLMHLPDPYWPPGPLPRHPDVIALNTPGWTYRYLGVGQREVAAWYLEVMARRGWKLAKAFGDERQVWFPSSDRVDPIVELRFHDDRLIVNVVRVAVGGLGVHGTSFALPCHPGDSPGSSCDAGGSTDRNSADRVWDVPNVSEREARAWYREFLGYLGWREAGADYYEKRPIELRWEYGEGQVIRRGPDWRGPVVTMRVQVSVPPPTGWPAPPPEMRDPLCEETRGKGVEIAGRVYQLHPALCVSARQPDRIRIQVAYGESYVELEPLTGGQRGASLSFYEVSLYQHFEPIIGMKLPPGPPRSPLPCAATPAAPPSAATPPGGGPSIGRNAPAPQAVSTSSAHDPQVSGQAQGPPAPATSAPVPAPAAAPPAQPPPPPDCSPPNPQPLPKPPSAP